MLAIGTGTSGAAQVDTLGWTDIGYVSTYQAMGLTLTSGMTYYVSIKAVDVAGNTGGAASSDGWVPMAVATKVAFTTQPSATGATNTALSTQPVVTLKDASNNTVTTSGVSIALSAWTDNTCSGTSYAGTMNVTSNPTSTVNGVANFIGVSFDTPGTIYLKASSSGLTYDCSTAINIPGGGGTAGWNQQAFIKAPNAEANDAFGKRVSISGDTIAVGAEGEDSNQTTITNGTSASSDNSMGFAGGVYVFVRTGASWTSQAYIKAPNVGASDYFGSSLSINGDTLVVGAPNESSNQTTITNGTTASADNSLLSAGAAYVFKRTGTTWVQEAYIKASNSGASDYFGTSVSNSGDTIVVGAPNEDSTQTTITNGTTSSSNNTGTDSGAAYVYRRSGTAWTQEAYVKAPNAGLNDLFGTWVAIDTDTIVVGATGEASVQSTITNGTTASADNTSANSGAAYVFVRTGTTWTAQAYIKASNSNASDYFGSGVALNGNTIVVSAADEDSSQTTITNGTTSSSDNTSTASGAAYVYFRSGSSWAQQAYLKASNANGSDKFGQSVSIHGDTIVVGATGESSNQTTISNDGSASFDNSATGAGAAYVFKRSGTAWAQMAYLKAPNAEAADNFGASVSISGITIVVGANGEDSSQTSITNGNTASTNNASAGSGAAYVFYFNESNPPSATFTYTPPSNSISNFANFGFTGVDTESGIKEFKCQLDGSGWNVCTSPQNISSLSNSTHTFQVKAIDNQNNESAPISYTWTVDTGATGPQAFTITGAMYSTADTNPDSILLNSTIVTAQWTSSTGAASGYDVTILDASGNMVVCATQSTGSTTTTFASCTLNFGSDYRIRVVAKGTTWQREATNNTYRFSVRQGAPEPFFVTGITGTSDSNADNFLMSATLTSFTLNWATATGATSYDATIYQNDGSTVQCATITGISSASTSQAFTCTLVAGQTYKARLVANKSGGTATEAFNSLFTFHVVQSYIMCTPTSQTITAGAAIIYDSGGVGGSYSKGETNCNITITPTAGTPTLNSTQWALNTTNTADYLTIYNSTTNTNLVGTYDYTTIPSNISGTSGSLYLAWVSDGTNTIGAGYTLNYTSNPNPLTFTITGVTGANDTDANSILTNGTIPTLNWGSSSTGANYALEVRDSAGTVTVCSRQVTSTNATSHTLASCSLSPGASYKVYIEAQLNGYHTQAINSPYSFSVDDGAPPTISIPTTVLVDRWGIASVPVTLSKPATSPISFNWYTTTPATGTPGVDYVDTASTPATIGVGKSQILLPIPIFSLKDPGTSKTFTVNLASISGGANVGNTSATVTIQNFTPPYSTDTWVAVASGHYHTCGLTSGGAVKCWGNNSSGQLGNGTTTESRAPVQAIASGASQIVAGANHTCARMVSGGMKCWGKNDSGQIGDGNGSAGLMAVTPADVKDSAGTGLLTGVSGIAAGSSHTCALISGSLKCWGLNTSGQLGDNSTTQRILPVDVKTTSGSGILTGVNVVITGANHTCARLVDQSALCWGNNALGQLGDGTQSARYFPVAVKDSSGSTSLTSTSNISAGFSHTCATFTDGTAKCWGDNTNYQMGFIGAGPYLLPVTTPGITNATTISSGQYHNCAVINDGTAKCWGINDSGQTGNGSPGLNVYNASSVVSITNASTTSPMALGFSHTCILLNDNKIKCWGYNLNGQLGDIFGSYRTVATDVNGLSSNVTAVALGQAHSCGIVSGTVKCWGRNNWGQIGNASEGTHITSPTNVSGFPESAVSVAVGAEHSCAVTVGGAVKCWGRNQNGQLGDGTTTYQTAPIQVISSGADQVVAGQSHTCARMTNGNVKCWGNNFNGQVGDGTSGAGTNRTSPTLVKDTTNTTALTGIAAISSGQNHTCARSSSGALYCWGSNSTSQLGDTSNFDRSFPVAVTGLSSGVEQVAAGGSHSCALLSNGTMKCWGYNSYGQLGDNNAPNSSSSPVLISGSLSFDTTSPNSISAGLNHTCARLNNGQVKCWGQNVYGQLGTNTTSNSLVPLDISNMGSGISSTWSGANGTCAITTIGALKCWGNNDYSQLGDSYHNFVPQLIRMPY
jgi:alpha-tubulin suppressor-like RCC1 family protein